DRAWLQLLGHLVQMDGLVVHPLIGIAAGENEQIVGIDRDLAIRGHRLETRAGSDRLLSHGSGHYRLERAWVVLARAEAKNAERRAQNAECRNGKEKTDEGLVLNS